MGHLVLVNPSWERTNIRSCVFRHDGHFLLTSIALYWAKYIFCLYLKTGNCKIKFKIWNSHIVRYKITIIIVRYEVAIAIQYKYTLYQVWIHIVIYTFAIMRKKITFESYILRYWFTIIGNKVTIMRDLTFWDHNCERQSHILKY